MIVENVLVFRCFYKCSCNYGVLKFSLVPRLSSMRMQYCNIARLNPTYVGFKGQRAILHACGGEPGDEAIKIHIHSYTHT